MVDVIPYRIPYGLAVRIPGFHPGGPGSTPGMGKLEHFLLFPKREHFRPSCLPSPVSLVLRDDSKKKSKTKKNTTPLYYQF